MTAPNKSAPLPEIDEQVIKSYVEFVFGYLEGFVPVRALSESGTTARKAISAFHAPEHLADALVTLAARAAAEARGVYVVPGSTAAAGSARATDIIQTGVVVIDLDEGDIPAALDYLTRHIGHPSMVVSSGGKTASGAQKLHLYWRLTEVAAGSDLERVRFLREAIALKVGGDSSFKSLHQPIRVPGTIHGKHGQCATVCILDRTNLEYDLDEIAEAIENMPQLISRIAVQNPNERPTQAELAKRVIRSGGVDGTTRFEALSSVIGHWIRNARIGHCDIDEAWEAVQNYNTSMIIPSWDEVRLRCEFDRLRVRDDANHGQENSQSSSAKLIPLSDDALATHFVLQHGQEWRHVATWGKWMGWDGARWKRNETGLPQEHMRQVCRAAAAKMESEAQARRIASHKTITAALRVATSDPTIAVQSSQWDTHPMKLNTPAGTVDLTTGAIDPHDPTLLITQVTKASLDQGCPRWLSFLDEITGGDRDLQAYLCRLSGYCLTGDTSEQVFAFFHGSGANGKSVFLQTLSMVLGDYASTAAQSTFAATRHDRHLSELAGLRAARLVTVSETEADRAWAEARIKEVTGGESIRANFMRQDFFEFKPQFKLIVAGNHKPTLSGFGEAMKRRLHLIPFLVTIPEYKRDLKLPEALRKEAGGILSWMLEGCVEWQRMGLAPPASVLAATQEYFSDEDLVGQWIEECCSQGPTLQVTLQALFQSWSAWATESGVPAGTKKSFACALRERGFRDKKVKGMRGRVGIALKHPGLQNEAAQ